MSNATRESTCIILNNHSERKFSEQRRAVEKAKAALQIDTQSCPEQEEGGHMHKTSKGRPIPISVSPTPTIPLQTIFGANDDDFYSSDSRGSDDDRNHNWTTR